MKPTQCKTCNEPIQYESSGGYWLHSDGTNRDHPAQPISPTITPDAAPLLAQEAWNELCEVWDRLEMAIRNRNTIMSHARYIGDGVYAQFDGYGIVLTTGSHLEAERDQCIIMEPEVVESFQRYISDLKSRLESEPTGRPTEI